MHELLDEHKTAKQAVKYANALILALNEENNGN